jgi:hypothetical protein
MRQMHALRRGAALRRERQAKAGCVDPHHRLTGFDLCRKFASLQYLTGGAKTPFALHPRAAAGEAALGSGHPRGVGQSDDRRFQPRGAPGRGFLRAVANAGTLLIPPLRAIASSEQIAFELYIAYIAFERKLKGGRRCASVAFRLRKTGRR